MLFDYIAGAYGSARCRLRNIIFNGVYVRGLQRSGTNFVTSLLSESGVRVLNDIDPLRQDYWHKHNRLHDKCYYPAMKPYTMHPFSDENVNQKTIFIYRDIEIWLPSITRWSKKCGWTDISTEKFRTDYEHYRQRMEHFKKNPLVHLLNFDNISSSLPSLSSFVSCEISDTDLQRIREKKIRHSPEFHERT